MFLKPFKLERWGVMPWNIRRDKNQGGNKSPLSANQVDSFLPHIA
nr:MAG TPA: hypothetical protein [Inoviridae sp.]